MTKAVYLIDSGIRPWTSLEWSEDMDFRTLTIVTPSKQSMLTILFSVFAILGQMFFKIFRWYTTGAPFSFNKIQLIKLKKKLSQDVPGFQNTFLRESIFPSVWCNTSELRLPFGRTHFDSLLFNQKTILILSSKENGNSEKAWNILSGFAKGFDLNETVDLLGKDSELVLARLYDEETHIAFQIYGSTEKMTDIENRLKPIGIILMTEHDDVVDFINAT